jgi:hypothetical protein
MTSLANFMVKIGGPYVATMSPEHAQHNEAMKAEALRRLLRISLRTAGAGAGLGLLAGWLGRKNVPRPESEDIDVDVPYPQLKTGAVSPTMPLLLPLVGLGAGTAYGAIRSSHSPGYGATYGAVRGLGEGGGAGLGNLGGQYGGLALGEALASLLPAGRPTLKKALATAGRWLGGTAGGAGGAYAGNRATDLLAREVLGKPPWPTKRADWADVVTKTIMPTTPGDTMPSILMPRWWRGDSQTAPHRMPWFGAAAAGAGLGGFFGGSALIRHLLKKKRQASLDAEVEAAKKEYEDAMMGQYDPEKVHKLASVKKDRLDTAFDVLEKTGWDSNAILGNLGSGYGALAAILAGASGYGLWRFLRDKSKAKLYTDALKQRALIRQLSNPPEVYLHPVPAHRNDKGDVVEDSPNADTLREIGV